MSNFDGLISTEFKQLFVDAINELLSDSGLTVLCKIITGSKLTQCSNCSVNIMTGKSSGRYKSGGPIPFTTGICPYCRGIGTTVDEQSDDIYMAVIWDSKQWIGKLPAGNPNEFVQTITKASNFTKLKKATHLIVDSDKEIYSTNKYERVSEPSFVEFGNDSTSDFIFVTWKRIS